MLLGEARDTARAVVAEFGVADYPALFMLAVDGPPVLYEGELKPAALTAYLERRAGPPVVHGGASSTTAESLVEEVKCHTTHSNTPPCHVQQNAGRPLTHATRRPAGDCW